MAVISVYAATGNENKRNAEDVERFYRVSPSLEAPNYCL